MSAPATRSDAITACGVGDLAVAQPALGVAAEVGVGVVGALLVVGVAVGQQPRQHRVVGRAALRAVHPHQLVQRVVVVGGRDLRVGDAVAQQLDDLARERATSDGLRDVEAGVRAPAAYPAEARRHEASAFCSVAHSP